MPSPDLRRYSDLILYDVDPIDLVDRARADASVKLPGWVPRAGNTELVLIEAIALEVAELVFAVNRLPGSIVEVLLRLYGILRSQGTPPTATVTFTVADNLGHEIPAGTRARLDVAGETVVFTTDVGLVIAAGATSGTVAVTGTTNTEAANGAAVGTALTLVDAIPFVEAAELATIPSGGTGPETESEWRDRGVEMFSRLVSTLVLPEHFTSDVLANNADVYRATTIDNWNVGVAANGHVTVAVLGEGGLLLSGARKTELELDLESKALANLDVHVIDPTITDVDVTVTVRRIAGADSVEVAAAVGAALDAYLDPDSWEWSATVRRFELVALVDRVPGVDYVVSLTVPAADVALPGVAPLADLGALVVNVTAP